MLKDEPLSWANVHELGYTLLALIDGLRLGFLLVLLG
jgi:hypothetical protein